MDETVLIEFQGVVTFDTVKIRAPDAGYVEALYVKEGDNIDADEELLQFSSPQLDAELNYLKREKNRMNEQIARINLSSTESLRAHLATLAKDVVSSQLVYDQFSHYYTEKGYVESLQLEQARKNLISAKQAYAQLKHKIRQVVLENDVLVEVNYKRKLEEVNSKIEQAEIKEKHFLIKSPAKGTVKLVDVHLREFLPAGQEIIGIVTKNNMHAVVFIDSKEVAKIAPGVLVSIEFPDHFKAKGEIIDTPDYADQTPMGFQNPLAMRENKLVAMVKFTEEIPEKYRVFGLPVDITID